MTDKSLFDEQLMRKGALIIRALKNNLRQKILRLVHKHQRITVTEIYTQLKIEQSVTSQHLRILRDARLVNAQRDGKQIYYSINYERLYSIQKAAAKVVDVTHTQKG